MPKSRAKDWWYGEVEKIPPFVKREVFLLSGALIPVWRQVENVKDAGSKIVRTTTDEGVRLVGLQVPKSTVKEIVRLFDKAWGREETASEIFQNIFQGKESLDLVENIRLKRSKFFGDFYVEIVPGRFEHPKKFRAAGLVSITQKGRERFLLPQNESEAVNLLQKIVSQFPPVSGINLINQAVGENQAESCEAAPVQTVNAELAPVNAPAWIIEPGKEEFARISFQDSLIA